MRMKVLRDKEVEIISPERMRKEFGGISTYMLRDGILYINEKALEEEKRKFGDHLSTEEIVEDMYIEARNVKNIKWRHSLWDELTRRHVKYKTLPIL